MLECPAAYLRNAEIAQNSTSMILLAIEAFELHPGNCEIKVPYEEEACMLGENFVYIP